MRWDFNLFVDLDGVLVDFEKGFEQAFGIRHDSVPENIMWQMINERERHWHDLPAMPGAIRLWTRLIAFKPTILTGCPRSIGFKHADAGKRAWCERELTYETPVITCASRDKPKFMVKRGDVLIDDMTKNTYRWELAGGRAIHFENAEQAIAKFEAILANDRKAGHYEV